MSCIGCDDPVTGDQPTIKTGCCFAVSHTTCFMNRMNVSYNEWFVRAFCPSCDTMMYSHDSYNSHPLPDVQEPEPEQTVPRDLLRDVKKKIAAKNKAIRAARAKIMEAYAGFKGQSAPLLTALKEMRSEALKQVRQSPEWHAYYRLGFIADKAILSVIKTYKLSRNQMIAYKLKLPYRRRNPRSSLIRKFRIRIG